MTSSHSEAPWYTAYPAPRSHEPVAISRQQLLQMFKDGKVPGKDFALVDLRRTDFQGGTIRGSVNLPAQSLYPTLPTIYTLLATAQVSQVIWYCNSSKGRGNRAAAWFADYLEDKGDTSMVSAVLTEGIKGWATAGSEYVELMLEYDSKVWSQ